MAEKLSGASATENLLHVQKRFGDCAKIHRRHDRNDDDDAKHFDQRESWISRFHPLVLLIHLTKSTAKSFELFSWGSAQK
jgi:hypothetical protein